MITLDLAILSTFLYFDLFSFPLTLEELSKRLIGITATPSSLQQRLTHLLSQGLIKKTNNFFHLPLSSSLPTIRTKRLSHSHLLLLHAKKHLPLFQQNPFLLGVYLTGSLASLNATSDADIDLLIITSNHTLWLTRLSLNYHLDKLHLRRQPSSSKTTALFCLNLFLTPAAFSHLPIEKNLYTASELVQITPLFERYPLLSQLLANNRWAFRFFPNLSPLATPPQPPHLSLPTHSSLAPLNLLAYLAQTAYMFPRLTNEKISYSYAFFHPRPLSPVIMQKLVQNAKKHQLLSCLNYIHSLQLTR